MIEPGVLGGADAVLDSGMGARWQAGVPEREQRRVWALDGKTVRSARSSTGGQVHLVSVLDQASGAVLAQVAVDAEVR
ncbi:hypothetical protein [Pseudonocardia sp. T1-2H]|uniref:hypothetical protein n=1 Tax=Pseudonocardia sp. T1-2H TaxID=3128899 RepID=UPI00310156C6